MSLFSRRQSEARAVLEADTLRIAERTPEPAYIDSFERFQLVKLTGAYAVYGGIVLEADRQSDELLVKWYDPASGAWMAHWWRCTPDVVQPLVTGISSAELRVIAHELLSVGRLPQTKNAQTEVHALS